MPHRRLLSQQPSHTFSFLYPPIRRSTWPIKRSNINSSSISSTHPPPTFFLFVCFNFLCFHLTTLPYFKTTSVWPPIKELHEPASSLLPTPAVTNPNAPKFSTNLHHGGISYEITEPSNHGDSAAEGVSPQSHLSEQPPLRAALLQHAGLPNPMPSNRFLH